MKIGVNINAAAALKAGKGKCGDCVVSINPEQWTDSEREVLISSTTSPYSDYSRRFPGADLVAVYNLSGLAEPTEEALLAGVRAVLAERERKRIEGEERAKKEKEKDAAERLAQLQADPKSSDWIKQSGYPRKGGKWGWTVNHCPWTDSEILAVKALAQAECDRLNAEMDAEDERKEKEKQEREEKAKEQERADKDKLQAWALSQGSELVRKRIEHGFDSWFPLARDEYAAWVVAQVASGLEEAQGEEGYDAEAEDRKNPTLDELKALEQVEEAIKGRKFEDGTEVEVELLRTIYTPEKDEDGDDEEPEKIKQTELQVSVTVFGLWQVTRYFKVG